MLILFTLGILAGSVAGLFSTGAGLPVDAEHYIFSEALPKSLPAALWDSGKYFLLLLVSCTSYLGVVAAPLTVLLRGYLLSCSISALFSAYAYRGLWYGMAISGVTAIFTMPCFLIAACDAFVLAWRLLRRRLGQDNVPQSVGVVWHFLMIGMLILLDACYTVYILPALLARF